MSGRKLVGRRGGSTGVGGRRGGSTSDGGGRDGRRDDRRDDRRDGRRDDRRDRRDDGRRVVGGNISGRRGGVRHGAIGDDRAVGDGGSMRNGGGGNSSSGASGSRGRGSKSLEGSGASGSCERGGRSLDVRGAGCDYGRGGKSVSGGSGSSRVGRIGRSRGSYSSHLGDDNNYDGSSESEDTEYDDEFDEGSEGEDSEGVGSEGDEIDGEGSEDEEVIVQYKRRGHSLGSFGRPPPQPYRIRMVGKVIDSPKACRTLQALMRVHWPVGCIGVKDVDRQFPKWWRRIRKSFFKYYQFDPEHGTLDDARDAVIKHMRRNMRKTLCAERRRIKKLIKENGGSFADYRPPYFTEAQWKPFCEHWDSPVFEKRSKAAKEARERQEIPHTSGAISFQRRAWDIKNKTGKEPKSFDLFVETHTKDKENKEFTSKAAREIAERYIAKCKEHNMDPFEAPLDTWVEVVGVRKNTIIGYPRENASELIPLPPTSGKRRRRRNVDDESGASTGRSIIEHMADHLVMQAVDRTVAFARANPDQFDLAPEQVNTLAKSVAQGSSELPADHPLTMTTMRELVRVMVSVLGDVHACNRPPGNCNKGKMVAREEEHHSGNDSDDEWHQFAPSPDRSRSGTLRIRGD